MRFRDRNDAGRRLAAAVAARFPDPADVVVLGLPRGGVPVARYVADALGAPLDVLCVRKLGLPSRPEFAMGAIGEGDVCVLDRNVAARAGVSEAAIDEVVRRERTELSRRTELYRGARPPLNLTDRIAIVVDDGLATGSTARAAVHVARAMGARQVVLAIPVAPRETVVALGALADDVIVLSTPASFSAVGEWYDDFAPTSDAEVIAALAGADPAPPANQSESGEFAATLRFPVDGITLEGTVAVPDRARGIVVFAHGSGSSRHSVRNRAVARRLRQAGFATVLFDLLTDAEAHDRSLVFDTEFLSRRLQRVTQWIATDPRLGDLPIGLFGASTGAAAALRVAATRDSHVVAVVSRGGRPDLAGDTLTAVRCPTLLIVGGNDPVTLQVNEDAASRLRAAHQLVVIPGATHLFEEPGALETVAGLAAEFFTNTLEAHRDARLGPPASARATG